jgi:hypothetical protein
VKRKQQQKHCAALQRSSGRNLGHGGRQRRSDLEARTDRLVSARLVGVGVVGVWSRLGGSSGEGAEMAANKGMVAGSHNRNEFVMIRHDGDAPGSVRPANPVPSSLPASDSVPSGSCRARVCRWIWAEVLVH